MIEYPVVFPKFSHHFPYEHDHFGSHIPDAAGVEVPLLCRLLDNNLIPISGSFGDDNRFFDAERVHI